MVSDHLRGLIRLARGETSLLTRRCGISPFPEIQGLEASENFDVHRAIYDETHLERVTGVGFGHSLQHQEYDLNTTSVWSSPPQKAVLQDVFCFGGHFYGANDIHYLSNASPWGHCLRGFQSYDHGVVTNSAQGLRYFGHWLRDDCAARELPLPGDATLFSLIRPDWPDCQFYETAFNQPWADVPAFFCRKLTVITDIGFSIGKRNRLARLRKRLRSKARAENVGDIVYIRRGPTASERTMVNEPALIERLVAAGIKVVDPETGGNALASALLDTSIIISIEGSQLAHATHNLAEGGGLAVIQPPDRFYNPHHEWARLLGMRYSFVVGQPQEKGYTVDPDEVLAMVDRLAGHITCKT